MISASQRQAIHAFTGREAPLSAIGTDRFQFSPLQGGLINHSFRLRIEGGEELLLQKFNIQVFKDPMAVQANYMDLWDFLQRKEIRLTLPEPQRTGFGESLFRDDEGEYWRAFRFIKNSEMHDVASSADEAYATAQTFGTFTASLTRYDPSKLRIVIPRFHDLSFRYEQFCHALENGNTTRIKETRDIIKGMTDRTHYNAFYQLIHRSPSDYPLRVMHHDAKIANVLFESGTGKVICAVDFDTVMPGYFFSDLGDMIRSMACNVDENDTGFDRIVIQQEIYGAIVSGYRSVMDPWLTEAEKKHIHHAGLLMIYMQALRFLTDHLENDRYYRITRPEQNKERAMNQWTLLQRLEEHLKKDLGYEPSADSAK